MRKFVILAALLVYCLYSQGQTRLLVTDFIFFNNFDSPSEAYIPDFFQQDPERLAQIKNLMVQALDKKFDSLEVSFHEKSTWFVGYQDPLAIEPSERYRDSHKKLVKEGGYDYFLRLYADVSSTTITNNSIEYTFCLQVRISDGKGKKVFRNILKAPFYSFFSESEINDGALISSADFYDFFELGIPKVFVDEKARIARKELYRSINHNFDDFTRTATSFVFEKARSKAPILKGKNSSDIELKVTNGLQDQNDRSALFSDNLELRTTIKIRNTALENDWKVWVAAESKKALGLIETAGQNASIRIRTEKQNSENFELQNGQLTGTIDKKSYLLNYESDAQLTIVYVDQKLTSLMQPNRNGKSSTLKVFFEGKEQDLSKILNLYQVYNQAIFTLREAHKKND